MLRVLTWNMAKRSASLTLLWQYLETHAVDVALLQESPVMPSWPEGWDVVWTPSSAPDTRIVARSGLHLRREASGALEVFGDYAVTGSIQAPGLGEVRLASVHALARKVFNHEFGQAGLNKFPGLDGPAWMGDLAVRLLLSMAERGRFIAGCDLNTSRRWGAGRLFNEAESGGLVDLTWRVWGEARPSYFTSRSDKHQLDYIFSDTTTAALAQAAWVDQELAQVQRVSDHAPMLVTLGGASCATALSEGQPMRA
jgi:hypothetical protein